MVDAVHDRFVELFAEKTRALRIGNGLDETEIGPLVSEAARAKVMRLVDDAVAHGAVAVTGGRVPPAHNVGWFYEPTILTGVTPDMAIVREECFGPVAAICRVGDFDEAIRLANDSPFGLGASVFTTDLAEAMEAAERLEAGMVWVNNPLIDNDALPFGGWKASGLGRELGRQGLDAFRRSKMVDHRPQAGDPGLVVSLSRQLVPRDRRQEACLRRPACGGSATPRPASYRIKQPTITEPLHRCVAG